MVQFAPPLWLSMLQSTPAPPGSRIVERYVERRASAGVAYRDGEADRVTRVHGAVIIGVLSDGETGGADLKHSVVWLVWITSR
jgi:hypothetical protein